MKNENKVLIGFEQGRVVFTLFHSDKYTRAMLTADKARAIRDALTRAIDAAERTPDDHAIDMQRIIDDKRNIIDDKRGQP